MKEIHFISDSEDGIDYDYYEETLSFPTVAKRMGKFEADFQETTAAAAGSWRASSTTRPVARMNPTPTPLTFSSTLIRYFPQPTKKPLSDSKLTMWLIEI